MRISFQSVRVLGCFVVAAISLQSLALDTPSQIQRTAGPAGVGISERLGDKVPVQSIYLNSEQGERKPLSDFLDPSRPTLVQLVYFSCPTLCSYLINGALESYQKLDWTIGNQFRVITVSIDPRENASMAAEKKKNYLRVYGRGSGPELENGWRFLTGEESEIKKLAASVGFGYRWVEEEKQYAHSAALFVLTPQAKISRVLFGIEFKPTDLKLALLEASNGKVGSIVEKILLFCYRYDPTTRRYSLYLTRVMKWGCAATTVAVGAYLAFFWVRQRRKKAPLGGSLV